MEPAPRILPHLSLHDLKNPILLQAMLGNLKDDYYWSDDFSPEFYTAQARAGFMAVTEIHHGRELLLPELQRSYALLDFDSLHVSRHVRRILKRNHPTLHVGYSLNTVAEKIQSHHKHTWLTPRYLATLKGVNRLDNDLHIISVLMRQDGIITAGEIGYILGRTYTSLSGFSSRNSRYRHHGTVQMVLLSRWLEAHGFAFWNLGQPWMPYKFALGAREYTRQDFLRRWQNAIRKPLPRFL